MQTEIVTFHLEMTSPAQLRPREASVPDLELKQARIPCGELNEFLYRAVGADWHWIDRLGWDRSRWQAWADRPELETWVAYVSGTPAGYFELERQEGRAVEIAYFGLLPRFVGKGLGGWLLTACVRRAWEMGASRVWLHTCTLDHPGALANYEARGFARFKEERSWVDL